MFNYRDDDLWQAVGDRDLAQVRRAVASGGNVNMVCPDGWVRQEMAGKRGTGKSLLHHAAWAGDLAIFKLLVDAGADVGRRRTTAWRPLGGVQGRGSTPLHHAVMYGRQPIVEYLIQDCGIDIDEPGEQGYTALHLATKFNYPRIVEMLLQAGARTDLITRDEKTARDLAKGQQDRSHAQMGEMLALFEHFDPGGATRARGAPLAPRPKYENVSQPAYPASPPAQSTRGSSVRQVGSIDGISHQAQALGQPHERPNRQAHDAREDSLDAELRRRGVSPTNVASSTPSRAPAHSRSAQSLGADSPPAHRGRGASGDARAAYHDSRSASQNVGNHIGTRSSVRQSKLFRMYESGNATKALLGQQSLQWDVDQKEGAYQGRVFDAFKGESYSGAADGREVSGKHSRSHCKLHDVPAGVSPGSRRQRIQNEHDNESSRWSTSSGSYGAGVVSGVASRAR